LIRGTAAVATALALGVTRHDFRFPVALAGAVRGDASWDSKSGWRLSMALRHQIEPPPADRAGMAPELYAPLTFAEPCAPIERAAQ
jgi:hypothetical protein